MCLYIFHYCFIKYAFMLTSLMMKCNWDNECVYSSTNSSLCNGRIVFLLQVLRLASILLYALSLDILPWGNGLQLDSIIQRRNAFLTPFQRKVYHLRFICSLAFFLYFLNVVYDINFHILVTVFKNYGSSMQKMKV